VAQEFIDRGYIKVFALEGGWNAWKKAGYPTEKLK
jgi:rhodanese-related sulfurtransferase